ncbi:hypothetical protein FOA43_001925 [Brettanomyces nanus]|uniref:Proteasome assembly chaperone 2 n=1 Tax=Eeniella nana TaxID=13502 RepID=A0A875S5X7_EENNA|nr:uncharacterized protein FOA43_001925 [Brettanomyces nanus]QPG74594.1 hypothetical protein FOA43_001925 [Brettanomyces nanus]
MSFHTLSKLNPLDILESFTGSTLILPVVSIGNIPQLALDILVYNLPDVHLVGRLDSTWLYPLVGPADYIEGKPKSSETNVSTPLEVYYCQKYNVTLLQQRTPILPGSTQHFFIELIKPFIELCEFRRVIVLQSNDQGLRQDKYSNKRLQLWTNDLAKNLEISLNMESKESQMVSVNDCDEISPVGDFLFKKLEAEQEEQANKSIEMGRSTSNLFRLIDSARTMELSEAKVKKTEKRECIVLSAFAYEGDNTQDAKLMYESLIKMMGIEMGQITTPKSWKGVYGKEEVPTGLEYGLYA